MHIFPRDRFVAKGLLTPGPLLRDLGAVVSEFNGGLDSENVTPDEITAPQLEFEGWNAFSPVELPGPITVTNSAAGAKSTWADIPGARATATTQDGVLHAWALLRWEDKSVVPYWFPRQLRICVDGGPVSMGPQVGWLYDLAAAAPTHFKGFLQAFGHAPVGAGSHEVTLQMRVRASSATAAVITEVKNLRSQVREGKR